MQEVSLRLGLTYMSFKDKTSYRNKQIKQLAKYLNLTMHQVDKHNKMLYEMDNKLLIMNKTLQMPHVDD